MHTWSVEYKVFRLQLLSEKLLSIFQRQKLQLVLRIGLVLGLVLVLRLATV